MEERHVKRTTEIPSVRVEMPRELYDQFKAVAKKLGKTRQEILLEYVQKIVFPHVNPLEFL